MAVSIHRNTYISSEELKLEVLMCVYASGYFSWSLHHLYPHNSHLREEFNQPYHGNSHWQWQCRWRGYLSTSTCSDCEHIHHQGVWSVTSQKVWGISHAMWFVLHNENETDQTTWHCHLRGSCHKNDWSSLPQLMMTPETSTIYTTQSRNYTPTVQFCFAVKYVAIACLCRIIV